MRLLVASAFALASAALVLACQAITHADDYETTSSAASCPSSQTTCGDLDAGTIACVDLTSDPGNCGACGAACPDLNVCSDGGCTCATGLTSCSGSCVDTSTDPANCGTCGTSCGNNHICSQGKCVADCPQDYTTCSNRCFEVSSSTEHCGSCGVSCDTGQICVNARCCSPDAGGSSGCSCDTPLSLCGSSCVDNSSDSDNCGMCGNVCPTGAQCTGSACVCPGNAAACSGKCCTIAGQGCTNAAKPECACLNGSNSAGQCCQTGFHKEGDYCCPVADDYVKKDLYGNPVCCPTNKLTVLCTGISDGGFYGVSSTAKAP